LNLTPRGDGGPELRAILGPEMERIRSQIELRPDSEFKSMLLARLADRGCRTGQFDSGGTESNSENEGCTE